MINATAGLPLGCCVHGVQYGYPCYGCNTAGWPAPQPAGWKCPDCCHVYAPHVTECTRCPQATALTLGPLTVANHLPGCDQAHGPGPCPPDPILLVLPAEMGQPGYVHVSVIRLGGDWREAWRDGGLQCRAVSSGEDIVQIHLRLTPPGD